MDIRKSTEMDVIIFFAIALGSLTAIYYTRGVFRTFLGVIAAISFSSALHKLSFRGRIKADSDRKAILQQQLEIKNNQKEILLKIDKLQDRVRELEKEYEENLEK